MADNILNHVKEGFFLLDSQLKISSQYSLALESIFSQKEIASLNLVDFIKNKIDEDAVRNAEAYLKLLFDPAVNPQSIQDLNPLIDLEFIFHQDGSKLIKYLNFDFEQIKSDENEVTELIVTVRDVTGAVLLRKRLIEEETRREKLLQLILGILDVEPEMLSDFSESTQRELTFIDQILNQTEIPSYRDMLIKAHRSMHLIKGNARLLNIDYFSQAAHKFEDMVEEIQKKKNILPVDIEPLREKLTELQNGLDEMGKLIERIGKVIFHKGKKKKTISKLLLQSLENLIKSFSNDLGKKIAFNYKHFDSKIIPDRYHLLLKEVLIQLVRNSISHGIEPPEERKKLKKPDYGKIEISTFKKNGYVGFRLRDDGRGLQIEKLKEKAFKSGRWKTEEIEGWSDRQIVDLIFISGISTSEGVDMIAGRGVGMEGVLHRIKEHHGDIQVRYEKGEYCEFEVVLPAAA